MSIHLKRVYEAASIEDGKRILVDRLWPRGLSKEAAAIDLWLKEVAPSTELRKWFDHDPVKWTEFVQRYRVELEHNPEQQAAFEQLLALARYNSISLVYTAKDPEHNQAVVLKALLEEPG